MGCLLLEAIWALAGKSSVQEPREASQGVTHSKPKAMLASGTALKTLCLLSQGSGQIHLLSTENFKLERTWWNHPCFFSTGILITQQKSGSWLYFHLKNALRMFQAIFVFSAQGLLLWSSYHLPSWGMEILLYLGNSCASSMHGLEGKMEVRKPLQLPESISSHKSLCAEYEVEQQFDCASPLPDDFHHIQTKLEGVFRQKRGIWVRA